MKKAGAVFLLIVVLTSSCGKKGPPLPPEEVRPKKPRNLTLKLHPQFAELSFKIPLENIKGEALSRIKAVWIEKQSYYPQNPSLRWTRIIKEPFKGDLSKEERFYWRDRGLKPGFCYQYRVAVVKGFRSRSDWSQSLNFCWTTPPQTPTGFEVRRLLPYQVFLSWDPVVTDQLGNALNRPPLYRVYRRCLARMLRFPLLEDTAFYDTTVPVGETCCYSVEPLLPYYGTLVPGFKTPEVCVKP